MVSSSACMTVPADALYDLSAARSDDQRRYMDRLEAEGVCFLFSAGQHAAVQPSGKHWYVVKNDSPYEGTSAHYLIVPHAHVSSFDELPDEAGALPRGLHRGAGAGGGPGGAPTG